MRKSYVHGAALVMVLSTCALVAGERSPNKSRLPFAAAQAEFPKSAEAWDLKQPDLRRRIREQYALPATDRVPESKLLFTEEVGGFRLERLELRTPSGTAPAVVFVPLDRVGRGPAVFWNLPVETEKFARDYMIPRNCVALLFDAPGKGDEKLRAAQLALNYLVNREDVDPDRVAAAAYGIRAPLVRRLAALNERVAATVLINAPVNAADDAAISGLIVPRPQFVRTADTGYGSQSVGVEAEFYRLYGLADILDAAPYDDAASTTKRWHTMELALSWLKDEL